MKKFAIIIILILAMVIQIGYELVEVDLGNSQSAEGKVDVIQDVNDDTTRLKHSNAWRQKFECNKE